VKMLRISAEEKANGETSRNRCYAVRHIALRENVSGGESEDEDEREREEGGRIASWGYRNKR